MFIGFNIIGSVCDTTAANRAAVNMLVKRERPGKLAKGALLEYKIGDKHIVHIFDPPHLLKSVRNNLLVKDLVHYIDFDETNYRTSGKLSWNENNRTERKASWQHVKAFYEYDCSNFFRLVPKITQEHIEPIKKKMKVSHATQVFSATLAKNMHLCHQRKLLPQKLIGTSTILFFFNELFDSVNGGDKLVDSGLKGPVRQNSRHYVFWEYAMPQLSKMKFGKNLKTRAPNKSNVLNHWITTIKGLKKITELLLKGQLTSVSLRRTNQDVVENFFSCIRSFCGGCKNPDARPFRCAYAILVINNLTGKRSPNANCEDDHCVSFLRDVHTLFMIEKEESKSCGPVSPPKLFEGELSADETDYKKNVTPKLVLGYIYMKISKKCDDCVQTITTQSNIEKLKAGLNLNENFIDAIN